VHQPLCNNIATAALSEKFPGFFWIVIRRQTPYIPGFNVLEFLSTGYTKKAWFMGLLHKKSCQFKGHDYNDCRNHNANASTCLPSRYIYIYIYTHITSSFGHFMAVSTAENV
jgi:hypothetical protein